MEGYVHMKNKKTPSKSTVWKKCSEYNRRKNADTDGHVACCSCGKVKHWKEQDCGHFYPRSNGKALYWTPENLHAQCRGCNGYHKERGKIGYTKFMIDKYGREFVDNLEQRARGIYRERKSDLVYWNEFYTSRLKALNE